jgi:hypothetical protein
MTKTKRRIASDLALIREMVTGTTLLDSEICVAQEKQNPSRRRAEPGSNLAPAYREGRDTDDEGAGES